MVLCRHCCALEICGSKGNKARDSVAVSVLDELVHNGHSKTAASRAAHGDILACVGLEFACVFVCLCDVSRGYNICIGVLLIS